MSAARAAKRAEHMMSKRLKIAATDALENVSCHLRSCSISFLSTSLYRALYIEPWPWPSCGRSLGSAQTLCIAGSSPVAMWAQAVSAVVTPNRPPPPPSLLLLARSGEAVSLRWWRRATRTHRSITQLLHPHRRRPQRHSRRAANTNRSAAGPRDHAILGRGTATFWSPRKI